MLWQAPQHNVMLWQAVQHNVAQQKCWILQSNNPACTRDAMICVRLHTPNFTITHWSSRLKKILCENYHCENSECLGSVCHHELWRVRWRTHLRMRICECELKREMQATLWPFGKLNRHLIPPKAFCHTQGKEQERKLPPRLLSFCFASNRRNPPLTYPGPVTQKCLSPVAFLTVSDKMFMYKTEVSTCWKWSRHPEKKGFCSLHSLLCSLFADCLMTAEAEIQDQSNQISMRPCIRSTCIWKNSHHVEKFLRKIIPQSTLVKTAFEL